ncbi:MAG: hypothetical protein WA081_02730 [Desulfosalsimonadaceae bacterium]
MSPYAFMHDRPQFFPQYTWQAVPGDGTRSFDYDADGNLTSLVENSAETVYIWNAENRLITVQPAVPTDGDKKVEFVYDYMGRRIKKVVYAWSSGNRTLSVCCSKNETYAFMHDRPPKPTLAGVDPSANHPVVAGGRRPPDRGQAFAKGGMERHCIWAAGI